MRRPLPYRRGIPTALVLCFAAASLQAAGPPPDRPLFGPGGAGPFLARNGMVATSDRHATLAGLETLRAGGNAVDALAVVQFVLAVVEPYASGIGGGLFILLYDPEGEEVVAIDGREEAPAAFHPEVFLDGDGEPLAFRERATGGLPVGVPGTLAAVAWALEQHGTLSLAEALAPAIRLAREGFVLDEVFARNLDRHADRLSRQPAAARLYLHEDGAPRSAGERFRNEDLAATLELIAADGADVFYRGELAREIVRTVRGDARNPGLLTAEDLAAYRPVRREPVRTTYHGDVVYGMNMPTSGGATLLLALNILEEAGLRDRRWASPEAVHLLAEAQNLAFADRNAYMADADFAQVPVRGLLEKTYAAERAHRVGPEALRTPVAPGRPDGAAELREPEPGSAGGSTTHFTIVDEQRRVVSVTSTIEQHFGAALVVPGRGFLLNNELTDFDPRPRDAQGRLVPNAPEGGRRPRRTAQGDAAQTEGGKRPRSSMSPTIVLRDGRPHLALGSPGGSRIIGITLNGLVNVLDFDMDVQTAIHSPRVVSRNGPLELEEPLHRRAPLRQALEARGHEVRSLAPSGSIQAIRIRPDGWLEGGADPRRAGAVLGY